MNNNSSKGCGFVSLIILVVISISLINYFGVKKIIMFIIDSILIIMIAPFFIGLLFFLFSKDKNK